MESAEKKKKKMKGEDESKKMQEKQANAKEFTSDIDG